MLLNGYICEMNFVIWYISLIIAKMGEPSEAFSVEVSSQWSIRSTKNVQAEVEFLVSN